MVADLIYLSIAVFISIFTPNSSQYKLISYILVADFAVFIGFDSVVHYLELSDGVHIDIYKSLLYFIFFILYSESGGRYLARLTSLVIGYHLIRILSYIFDSSIIFAYDYGVIMNIACMLYLLIGFAGMLYGIDHRNNTNNARSSLNNHGPTRCH